MSSNPTSTSSGRTTPAASSATCGWRHSCAITSPAAIPRSSTPQLRDTLPLFGAQRLVNLGYAGTVTLAMPQDAIEPVRRMCKWVVDEECEERVPPMWERSHWDVVRALSQPPA